MKIALPTAAILALCSCAPSFAASRTAANAPRVSHAVEVAPSGSAGGEAAAQEKIVINAEMSLDVADLDTAAQQIRELAPRLGGKLTTDALLYRQNRGSFVLRVPSQQVAPLFAALAELGTVLRRRVEQTDVTREYVDNSIQLDNLRKELARYRELLQSAKAVDDMLAVEQQLARVKREIERIEGALALLSDRVDLATVTVNIYPATEAVGEPQAKFHPGLRASYLLVATQGEKSAGYYGPGVSVSFARRLHIDVSVLTERGEPPLGADAIVAEVGGEAYSDFLGGGRRAWLNPYLGFAVGYLHQEKRDFFDAALSLGLELYKSELALLDLSLRVHALVRRPQPAIGVEPALTLSVAF